MANPVIKKSYEFDNEFRTHKFQILVPPLDFPSRFMDTKVSYDPIFLPYIL